MFSTTMIASSTSTPSAMAMPPSVIVLIVPPPKLTAMRALTTETGMAASVTSVARHEARKTRMMIETRTSPSTSAVATLSMARWMKSD